MGNISPKFGRITPFISAMTFVVCPVFANPLGSNHFLEGGTSTTLPSRSKHIATPIGLSTRIANSAEPLSCENCEVPLQIGLQQVLNGKEEVALTDSWDDDKTNHAGSDGLHDTANWLALFESGSGLNAKDLLWIIVIDELVESLTPISE